MASVIFLYNEIKIIIQCSNTDKMKDICNKYACKINKNINSLYFIYGGNYVNQDLTFNEQANSIDKNRKEMNILVIDYSTLSSINSINNELKCKKCGERFNLEIFKNLIKFNNNQIDKLNELKTQIELINNVNDINEIKIKLKYINLIVNNIIEEIKKNKNNIQYIYNNNNKNNLNVKTNNNLNIKTNNILNVKTNNNLNVKNYNNLNRKTNYNNLNIRTYHNNLNIKTNDIKDFMNINTNMMNINNIPGQNMNFNYINNLTWTSDISNLNKKNIEVTQGNNFENIFDDRDSPGPKINLFFKNVLGNQKKTIFNMIFNYETTVSQALNGYLKTKGKSENHNKINFFFNTKKLNLNDQTPIIKKFIKNSIIVVFES
jgi:hypothetical protein